MTIAEELLYFILRIHWTVFYTNALLIINHGVSQTKTKTLKIRFNSSVDTFNRDRISSTVCSKTKGE